MMPVPWLAVIVAVPAPTAVTVAVAPLSEVTEPVTVATVASPVSQYTARPPWPLPVFTGIELRFASLTVALSVVVPPTVRLAEPGDTATDAGVWFTFTGRIRTRVTVLSATWADTTSPKRLVDWLLPGSTAVIVNWPRPDATAVTSRPPSTFVAVQHDCANRAPSPAPPALCADAAAVHLDEALRDREAEPGAAGEAGTLAEEVREPVGRDSPPLVRDRELDVAVLVLRLDLMLPGTDGIELMKHIPGLADLPVIFISGYGRDETIARALESGAADYIVKPFSPTELVARVRAALRHRAKPETFVLGDLSIGYGRRRVSVAGRYVPLTATEFDLLRVLSLKAGRVVTTETLLRQVWQRRGSDDNDRVRTVVKKLRAKLGDDAANPAYLFTQHGVGYRIGDPGEA